MVLLTKEKCYNVSQQSTKQTKWRGRTKRAQNQVTDKQEQNNPSNSQTSV